MILDQWDDSVSELTDIIGEIWKIHLLFFAVPTFLILVTIVRFTFKELLALLTSF